MPSTSFVAKSTRPGLLTETMLVPETNWAMPVISVPVPRVTTNDDTSITTTKNALTTPASTAAPTPITQASTMFMPCTPASTGMVVAVSPITAATERSNSPTARVTSADMARNTSTCWDPKIEENVPWVPNVSGTCT